MCSLHRSTYECEESDPSFKTCDPLVCWSTNRAPNENRLKKFSDDIETRFIARCYASHAKRPSKFSEPTAWIAYDCIETYIRISTLCVQLHTDTRHSNRPFVFVSFFSLWIWRWHWRVRSVRMHYIFVSVFRRMDSPISCTGMIYVLYTATRYATRAMTLIVNVISNATKMQTALG